MGRDAVRYLIAAVGCALFSAGYEYFSHSVYSVYMIGLPLFPLLLGSLPALVLRGAGRFPSNAVRRLLSAGVATLALGSCMTGVFEIYGSPSPLTWVYWCAGAALLLLSGAAYLIGDSRKP